MELNNNLFLGEGIKKPQKLIDKLNKGKVLQNFYLAGFKPDSGNLEILNSRLFFQKYFRNLDFTVTGIFKSEEDAFEYIRCLSELSVKIFNEVDIKRTVDEASVFEISEIFNREEL